MMLTYKYRLLPNKRQVTTLALILESQRQLYNAALQERIECYKKTGKGLTFVDQAKSLTVCRRDIQEMGKLPVALQRWTLKRLDQAFVGFFRRCKRRKGSPGFPRFRNKLRWRSFGFSEFFGVWFDGKRLRFKGFPSGIRVHLHRPMPKGSKIRCCSLTKDCKGWYVSFQLKIIERRKRTIGTSVGLDVGIKVLAHQSDGRIIPNPKVAKNAERLLRKRSRALSRCKRGSKRRSKVKLQLTRASKWVAQMRHTFLHQQSKRIVKSYDLIAVEKLNVANMVQHPTFAKAISDAAWATFINQLAYKAERAGKHFVRVPSKNTSQKCSGCGVLVPKTLLDRTHACLGCGLVLDRDHNAAINILNAGVLLRKELNVT